jgi:hypothetical protein
MKIKGWFTWFFIMAYVGNLDTCFGVTLVYFHNGRGGWFIRKKTDPIAIIIRDVELMARCFMIFVRIYKISLLF